MTVRWVRLIVAVALAIAVYFVLPVDADARGGPVLRSLLVLVALVVLGMIVLTQVRMSAAHGDRRIDGLIGAIVIVWLVFALLFYVVALHDQGQLAGLHTRIDALYFAASTMLTIGFGDVHAAGQGARALVLVQMVFDVVFVTAATALVTSRLRRAVDERQGRSDDAR